MLNACVIKKYAETRMRGMAMNLYEEIYQENMEMLLRSLAKCTLPGKGRKQMRLIFHMPDISIKKI